MFGGVRVCRGCQGVLGAGRDSRYSGTRRVIGGIGAPRGHRDCLGVSGVYWGLAGTL